jgi:hypothetical protein
MTMSEPGVVASGPQRKAQPVRPVTVRDKTHLVGLESETVKRPSRNIFRFRSIVALALMLWCAGTGCILVTSARATTGLETHSTSEVEASGGSHSSCHGSMAPQKVRKAHSNSGPAGVKSLSLPAMPTSSGAMSCCPLTSGSIATASRVQTNDDHLTAVSHDDLSYLPFGTQGSAPLASPLRLPNQNQTYLRCCVFLI